MIKPEGSARAAQRILRSFSTCQHTRQEINFPRQDGTLFWAEVEVIPTGGEKIDCALLIRDISRHKNAQEAHQVDRDRLAVTLGSIGEGVITTDVNGAVDYVNREGERLIGQRGEEVVGSVLQQPATPHSHH